jgi:LysR family transcriptional activator of nhaA
VPKALCSRLVKLARRERAQSTLLLKEGAGDGLFRDLLEHRLDLVLADEKPSPTRFPGLASRSLGRLPVVICGAPRFQGLRKAFPNSLNGQPFLLPSVEHPLRGELEAFLRKYKVKVDPVVEALDMSLQKLLAAQGLGLIAMVKPAASALLRDKRLVEIGTCSGVHEEFFLVHAPRRVPHPLAESLLRSFRM